MRSSLSLALTCSAALVLAACGGDGELDRDVVTNLPSGSANGVAASGAYRLQIRTRSCNGSCSVTVIGISWHLCEVDENTVETVTVVQKDGTLKMTEIGSTMYVDQMHGGINADGSFDGGGYNIQQGSSVGVTIRVRGTIATDGTLVADAQGKGNGSYDSQTISCRASYEVTGQRSGPPPLP
jgi:hypothetical protein